MRKMFTQSNRRQILTTTLVLFGSLFVMAQTTVEILAPANIARSYTHGYATYGGNGIPEVSASLMLTEDASANPTEACEPLTNDLTGKIAVSDRGNCNFSIKAYNAQIAGAVGAIICNTDDDVFNMGAGNFAELITIPHIMLSSSDCQSLKNVMAIEEVTGKIFFDNWGFDDVLWGDGADGADFDMDFTVTGWTTEGISDPGAVWTYSDTSTSDGACGSFNLRSPTESNGCVLMDGDKVRSGGSAFPCGTNSGPVNGELISPVIDASSFSAVALRFWHFDLPVGISEDHREPGTSFSFSTDGGATWSTPELVATESEQNRDGATYVNPQVFNFVIPEAAGAENFRFKFIYDRARLGLYNWMIDDVALVRPFDNDPVVEDAFYTPLSTVTPLAHIGTDTFGFSVNVRNAGIQSTANFVSTVRILDANDNVMMEQVDTRVLPAVTRDTVRFNSISVDYPVGDYRIIYNAELEDIVDERPGDTEIVYNFNVSERHFAKENAVQADLTSFTSRDIGTWYWGAFYTMGGLATGDELRMDGITLAAGSTDGTFDGETFAVYLLKWSDTNNNYPDFGELNMANISPLAHPFLAIEAIAFIDPSGRDQFEIFDVKSDGTGTWVDGFGNPLDMDFMLEAGATYALIGEFIDASVGFSGVNTVDPAGLPGILQNNNGTGEYFSNFVDFYPVLRLEVGPGNSATGDVVLTDNQAKVYPTLTNDFVNVELNFDESVETEISILDLNGRILSVNKLGKVAQTQVQQDFSSLSSGFYLVNISSSKGTKTVPVTVIK